MEHRDLNDLDKNMQIMQKEYEEFLEQKQKLRPEFESLKVIVKYILLGTIWILFSDYLVTAIFRNPETVEEIQLYKGWFYVFVTGGIFYLIINRVLNLYSSSVNKILSSYEELTSAHEELITMNDELMEYIVEHERLQEYLQHLAYYDTLTELPNKTYLEKTSAEAIADGKKFAIVNLDLDNFKHINDTIGHAVGDSYIQFVAKLLSQEINEPDVVVRLSGDQFAFLIHIDEGKKKLYEWFDQLLKKIRNPWKYNGQEFVITGSLGVAFYPEHGKDFSILMQNSDIAMFYQKEHGKDGFTIYEMQMFEKTLHNIVFHKQLKEAIERKEFILHYQPQFDLATGKLIGVEALIRWLHPEQGFISPAEFIPFSEQTGQIIPISEWVLQEALLQKIEWESKGYPHIKMAINFSGYIFNDKEIFSSMCKQLEEMQINPKEIEIEVTETAVMMELEKAKHCLYKLKELGISIAMDDFGSGYSSLNYLQILPFDVLKIDKEFIKNIKNVKETHIYQMVVDLAHKLGLSVVAEGIETVEQIEFLISHNCDIGQGYYLCKPVTANEIEQLLSKI